MIHRLAACRRGAALALSALSVALGAASATGCAGAAMPRPEGAIEAYARAAREGDAEALHEMMTTSSQRSMGLEGVRRAVADARAELAAQGAALAAGSHATAQTARVRFGDGERATLALEADGFKVAGADALPAGARSPADALEQLRKGLARRSYAAVLRVLSRESRAAIERDLRGLVEGLERPEGLDVRVQGDRATVQVKGGHLVRLRREEGVWTVEDFD